MPTIHLSTYIKAPVERCFLFSLSVDLHKLSTQKTNEEAIAGVTKGLMKLGDVVTWRAKHFGIYQNLTSKITAYEAPRYFVSEMQKGAFKKLYHQHLFEEAEGGTVMKDVFEFEAPLGILGSLFATLVLKRYMRGFLEERNRTIKEVAEGNGGGNCCWFPLSSLAGVSTTLNDRAFC
jgi:ligand-binding SRPBCC domain-containing protein